MSEFGYSNKGEAPSPFGSDINIALFFSILWKGKWLILFVSFTFAVAAYMYAKTLPNVYKSEAVLSPVSSKGQGGLGSLAGSFGGLASLAGISLDSSNSVDKTTIALEWLKTWDFLEKFVIENDLQVLLYAVKDWNKEDNFLIYDDKKYDLKKSIWLNNEHGISLEPDGGQLFSAIKNRVSASLDKKTGLVKIKVTHYSPYVAKEVLDLLVNYVNEKMKFNDRKEALESIQYLKKQIQDTDIKELQSIFYQLIEEQTKTLMLTEVRRDYVFKTISPSKVDKTRVAPARAVFAIISAMLGFLLISMVVLVRGFKKNLKK